MVSSHGVDFYWRMIEESDEVEGVIVGKNTNSFVAVGKKNMLGLMHVMKSGNNGKICKILDS